MSSSPQTPPATPPADSTGDAPWRLDPQAARQALDAGAVLVDVRPPHNRGTGLIPGAKFVAKDEVAAFAAGVPGSQAVILFCNTGAGAFVTASATRALGLTRVVDIRGGLEAWKAAGLPHTPPASTIAAAPAAGA